MAKKLPKHQSHSNLHEALRALPHIPADQTPLSAKQITAARAYLISIGSGLPAQLQSHFGRLTSAAIAEAEPVPGHPDVYVLSEMEIRSMLAGAAITGAMQTAYSVGDSLTEAAQLRELVAVLFEPTNE